MTAQVQYLTAGQVRIGILPIERGLPRRQAERRAVAAIVQAVLGPAAAAVEHRADGSPYIPGYCGHISVSHSRHLAAVAFSPDAPVGIDIESADRAAQLARVAPRVLSQAEMARYAGTPEGLLKAWTLKEALYKVAGCPDIDWRTGLQLPENDTHARAGAHACEIIMSAPLPAHWLSAIIRE